MARILITDDHAEARRGVRRLLEGHPGWEVCGEAENALEAIEKAAALKPDLVILDLSMPKMSGLEAGRIIHRAAPQLPLLMFSLYAGDPQMMAEFRDAGFSGDVNKATANLLSEAVETLLRGGTYSNPAQCQEPSLPKAPHQGPEPQRLPALQRGYRPALQPLPRRRTHRQTPRPTRLAFRLVTPPVMQRAAIRL